MKYFFFFVFIVFLIGTVFAAPTQDGSFYYKIVDKTCRSGPNNDNGGVSSITITEDSISGPCNGDGVTPGWGTQECCLQICEDKNISKDPLPCELKPEYISMLESRFGPLEQHIEKIKSQQNNPTTQPLMSEDQANLVLTAIGFLVVSLIISFLFLYFINFIYFKIKVKELFTKKLMIFLGLVIAVIIFIISFYL